ncbi:hypothetical protein [Streptomyces sp. CH6]|uniref:hypothetical protein n=1 Tax=unclassified Streptomyces TaxID=2593676 RepID=UPI003D00B816
MSSAKGTTDPSKTPRKTAPTYSAGDRPSLRLDDDLAADLADLMRVHDTFAEAVRTAVAHLATTYRTGWAHRVCPPDRAPVILAYQLGDPARIPAGRPIGERMTAPPRGPIVATPESEQRAAARPDARGTARPSPRVAP